MNLSPLDTYIYPSEVEWKVDQNNFKELQQLADKFNSEPFVTGMMIQHEYGIYGGADGEHILPFLEKFRKPILVTLHTVLPNPSQHMKEVTSRIIKRANIIVVLTHTSKLILEEVYPESKDKVHVIPHGVHETAFEDTIKAKKKLKLENTTVLSTFGLLSRGKGIEYVIKALPDLVKKYPSLRYLILGETHPVVRRNEGESYRNELSQLVTELHLENYVKFYDQYLTLTHLIKFLKATDIYISTSINPNQAVSGTLSYALGTGRAAVSTSFSQAKEIITNDMGSLVPILDSKAYSKALIELLEDKQKLKIMHRNAYKKTRPMLWSNVASEYSKLLKQNILPPLNLRHLKNMTDSFGLFQFAQLEIPNKEFGYTLDDNARALVLCCWLKVSTNKNIDELTKTYLQFIKNCQLPDGTFINYIDHTHKGATKQNTAEDLEDVTARAMWALAEVMKNESIDNNLRELAKQIFFKALPLTKKFLHIRSNAFLIKAFAIVANIDDEYRQEFIDGIKRSADFLISELERNSIKHWQWFDTYLGYNNAVIPESLIIAGKITNITDYTKRGVAALTFLISKTFSYNRYMPIGHSQWYKNEESRSIFDQQPEDPASMILALVTAYEITHDEIYKKLAANCFSWFLGNNSLQLPLYNYETGGCYDGLHPDRVNLNQGAESQVSYLLSRLSIEKLYLHENSTNKKYFS